VINGPFWRSKIADNRRRDATKCHELRAAGFNILMIWECELREPDKILEHIRSLVYGAKRKSHSAKQ
jgi:DNA mismatch endonuclease (patch repair protein)